MEYYSESKTWTEQFPGLLPPGNRLHENQVLEYYWNWNNNKVHVDHYKCEASPVRIVMLHGVGGNGRLLSFIAAPLHRSNLELIALDLPGYGLTKMNDRIITYKHWIEMGRDFLAKEQQNDPRPIILFGLSAGGMLAYQAACLNKKIKGIIATTLLDQRLLEVRRYSAIYPWMARPMGPILKAASAIMPGVLIPMKKVANMKAIVNNKELLNLLINDPTSSGTKVSIAFINTLLEAYPEIEPEEFNICPMLLAHPEKDLWTPVEISELFFNRLNKINKQLVILENAGHFPIESPGLQQLEDSILGFIGELN
jgi:alpha-beta hydrolase superfamily lysophospholipase